MQKIRPVVKIHGGKSYLVEWLIENFPEKYEEMTYCEPFCGGGSVLLNKQRSAQEVVNDLDVGLANIFKAIRDEPKEFVGRLRKVKYSEATFLRALKHNEGPFDDYLDHAVNEYITRRMSRGGLKKAFSWSERKRGGKPGDENAWLTMLKQLPKISERLQNVTICTSDFRQVVKVWDEENTFIYLDPTYLPSTRSKGATQAYSHEMTVDDHVALLNLIKNARAKVMISGYYSPLYAKNLDKTTWRYKKKDIANHSGQGKTKERRTEYIWINY